MKNAVRRFGATLYLDNPLHRQAWTALSAIPAGQRTNRICMALCQQAQREQFLQDMETIIRRELRNGAYPTNTSQPQEAERVNDDVLSFLRSLQEEGGESRTNHSIF